MNISIHACVGGTAVTLFDISFRSRLTHFIIGPIAGTNGHRDVAGWSSCRRELFNLDKYFV